MQPIFTTYYQSFLQKNFAVDVGVYSIYIQYVYIHSLYTYCIM